MNEQVFKEWLYSRIGWLDKSINSGLITGDGKLHLEGQLMALNGIREGMFRGSFEDE